MDKWITQVNSNVLIVISGQFGNRKLLFEILNISDQGYQLMTPAYIDQNGQIVNHRLLGPQVRLVSPAPLLVNPGQQQGRNN